MINQCLTVYKFEYQPTYTVQHRLMYHIYQQAVSAYSAQYRYVAYQPLIKPVSLYGSPQDIAEDIQKDTRQYREVISREKAPVRKAEKGEPLELIYRLGQLDERMREYPYISLRNIVAQDEEYQRYSRTDPHIDLIQQTPQRVYQYHGAA